MDIEANAAQLARINGAQKKLVEALRVVARGDVDAVAGTLARCDKLAVAKTLVFESKQAPCDAPMHKGGPTPVLTGRGLRELAASPYLRGIRSLTLSHLEDEEGARALAGARWPSLRELRVYDVDESAGPILCAGLRRIERLQVGYLSATALRSLAKNPEAARLRVLLASGFLQEEDPIDDAAFMAFVKSGRFSKLQALDATNWQIGARSFKQLGMLKALRALDVADIELDAKSATALGSCGLPLRTLYLEGDAAVVRRLAPLLKRVEALAVYRPQETEGDDVIEALHGAGCTKLKALRIGGSNQASFTNAGADRLLADFPLLRALDYTPSRVSRQRRDRLGEKCPDTWNWGHVTA